VVNGLGQAKEQDLDARQTIYEDAPHKETDGAYQWAAHDVPQRGRLRIVDLLDGGSHFLLTFVARSQINSTGGYQFY